LLRQELAKILGYANWADYRTRGRMAKSAANASDLMNDLRDKLKPRLQKDLDLLLEGKKADDPNADRLEAWDIRYYTNQVKKKNFSLDDEEIRQYFPKDTVMKGVFEIYE